jgi:magnesium-protoporphyrin IX monomethyl ester (oxidative) cyclase
VIDHNVEDGIRAFKPDIVGISAVTQNYNRAIEYARIAKKRGIPALCGGVHISMLPASLDRAMDAGILGEGEETICELYGLYRKDREFSKKALKDIRGIVYHDENVKVVTTEPREQIEALDAIPFPARDLFQTGNATYIFSSRGCPYACRFCVSSRFWKRVRFFSAEYVAGELEHLFTACGTRMVNFYDDLFCADIERTKKIVDLLGRKGLLGRLEFTGSIRANLVTEDVAKTLKMMGFSAMGIGLESGCDTTLAYLKGKGASARANMNAVSLIRRHGMKAYGSFIIGSPSETKADMLKTLGFIKESGLSLFDVYALTPFPGTPVWDYAKSKGLVGDDMDWSVLNVDFERNHNSAVILSETMDRGELYGVYRSFRRYAKYLQLKNRLTGFADNLIKAPYRLFKRCACAKRGWGR